MASNTASRLSSGHASPAIGLGMTSGIWESWGKLRWPRWMLVLVIVVLFGLVPSMQDEYEVCRQELAAVGDEPVVEVCGPPGLTDLAVVSGLLVLVVLLAPELSEVSIGVISLKQRLETTEKKQEAIERELSSLALSSSSAVAESNATTTAMVTNTLSIDDRALRALVLDEETEAARHGPASVDSELAQRLGELLLLIGRLEFLLDESLTLFGSGLPKIKLWFVTVDVGTATRKHAGTTAFADDAKLLASKSLVDLGRLREVFTAQYQEQLGELRQINAAISIHSGAVSSMASGQEPTRLQTAIDAARVLTSAFLLQVAALPDLEEDGEDGEDGQAAAASRPA